jgi:hypothetical protein
MISSSCAKAYYSKRGVKEGLVFKYSPRHPQMSRVKVTGLQQINQLVNLPFCPAGKPTSNKFEFRTLLDIFGACYSDFNVLRAG